jgi:hypothetical protein
MNYIPGHFGMPGSTFIVTWAVIRERGRKRGEGKKREEEGERGREGGGREREREREGEREEVLSPCRPRSSLSMNNPQREGERARKRECGERVSSRTVTLPSKVSITHINIYIYRESENASLTHRDLAVEGLLGLA